jgi:hypothetical protein
MSLTKFVQVPILSISKRDAKIVLSSTKRLVWPFSTPNEGVIIFCNVINDIVPQSILDSSVVQYYSSSGFREVTLNVDN